MSVFKGSVQSVTGYVALSRSRGNVRDDRAYFCVLRTYMDRNAGNYDIFS